MTAETKIAGRLPQGRGTDAPGIPLTPKYGFLPDGLYSDKG